MTERIKNGVGSFLSAIRDWLIKQLGVAKEYVELNQDFLEKHNSGGWIVMIIFQVIFLALVIAVLVVKHGNVG